MPKYRNVRVARAVAALASVASVMTAGVTACNFVSTDGLEASGNGDGGTTTIIIVESPDATTAPGVDATIPDAAASDDAAPDADAPMTSPDAAIPDAAVVDAAADAGPFCASPALHTLCFDFEEGNLLFATSNSSSTAYLSKDLYGVGMMGLTTMGPQPFPQPDDRISLDGARHRRRRERAVRRGDPVQRAIGERLAVRAERGHVPEPEFGAAVRREPDPLVHADLVEGRVQLHQRRLEHDGAADRERAPREGTPTPTRRRPCVPRCRSRRRGSTCTWWSRAPRRRGISCSPSTARPSSTRTCRPWPRTRSRSRWTSA